ncbi:unnamed protein product [Brachionus calyciflorus]|uniref:Uncharacterized protein n=1 Tax=Brachionus calyciflorus TaxID=104777 RepID=A0A813S2K1_9BILA|nr:unnamed protein product [Brachionus calyciflorus]
MPSENRNRTSVTLEDRIKAVPMCQQGKSFAAIGRELKRSNRALKELLTVKMKQTHTKIMVKSWPLSKWRQVLFSDEMNIEVDNHKNRIFIRRTKAEKYNQDCIIKRTKQGSGSIGIWFCMSYYGLEKAILIFVGHVIFKSHASPLYIIDFTKEQSFLKKVAYLNESNEINGKENLVVKGMSINEHFYFYPTYIRSDLLELVYENDNFENKSLYLFLSNKINKLQLLSLKNCKISNLDKFSFKDAKYLKNLNLSNNKIEFFSSYQFYGLENLEVLNLRSNSITNRYRQFELMKNLKVLNLSVYNLKKIDADDFKGLNNLEELHLSNCSIEIIDPNAFSFLNKLSVLNVSCNRIFEFKINRQFSNLTFLNIGLNVLREIDFLAAFNKLEYLDLIQIQEHIPITNPYMQTDILLPNLKFLRCNCNFMPTFDLSKIQGLVVVGLLDLNKVFFDKCINLDYLELSLMNDYFIDKLNKDFFKSLDKRIKFLSLKFFTVNSQELLDKLKLLSSNLKLLFNGSNIEKKIFPVKANGVLTFSEILITKVEKTEYFEKILNVSGPTRRALLNII